MTRKDSKEILWMWIESDILYEEKKFNIDRIVDNIYDDFNKLMRENYKQLVDESNNKETVHLLQENGMSANEYLYDIQPQDCIGEISKSELQHKIICGNILRSKLNKITFPSGYVLKRLRAVEEAIGINLKKFIEL